jgi:outer membrane autotransporter protein
MLEVGYLISVLGCENVDLVAFRFERDVSPQRGAIAKRIACALILLFLLLRFASPAAAQCSNTAPTSGATVTCSGTSATPVVAAAGSTSVTIIVNPGASVSGSHTAAVSFPLLSVETSSVITNNGTLSLSGGAGTGTNRGAAMLGDLNGNTLTNAAGATISTTGAFNDGMAANGSSNTLTNNGTITTTGPNAYGMTAAWGQTNTGQLNNVLINTGTVSTSGSNARAASILGGSGTINNSGTLSTTGGSSNGAYLQGNNDQLINSGKIITSGGTVSGGTTSDAVFSNTLPGFRATIQNLAGGQIISANAAAIRTLSGATTIINAGLLQSGVGTAISGGTGNVSLILQTGSSIIGTANGGAGTNTVTLQGTGTASNPFVNFQTLIMQGTVWNFTGTGTFATANLQSGTFNLTGTLGTTTNVNVSSSATLNMEGVSQTFGNVTNAGTIMTSGLGPGTMLVANNYVGNNGNLLLNTFLGTDNSPSDQLVINGGTATGSTSILISNVGGPGLPTTANGILVVNAINGATTTPASFTLDNPQLRAGAFDYRLFMGGLNGTDPNDWFLRTSFIVPPTAPIAPTTPAVPPMTLIPPTIPTFPDQPPPPTLPPGVLFPIIGPQLATYGVVQPVARELGLATLGTLHQRIGDTLTSPYAMPVDGTDPSVWGRVFGQQIRDHFEAFADPRADGSLVGFQSGVDLWRGSIVPIVGHRDATGIYFAYGNAAVDVNGLVTNAAATNYVLTKTGTVNFNAWTGGAYWTHYGPTDWYIDAVVQGTFYQGNAATQFANLPLDGVGFASSLEAGYPIPMPWFGPRFALEPEAQIVWQRVSFDDANDGLGSVSLGDTSGASGRIGLRGQWTIVSGEPVQPQTYQKVPTKAPQLLWSQVWQPYVQVDLWRDWGADATTAFGSDLVPLLSQATRLDLAAGLTARITANVSLYAQGGYQFAIANTAGGQRDGVMGDLGLRYTW